MFNSDGCECYECKTNGLISDSILQNWTPSALDCYKINCNCALCPISHRHYSFKCKMKEVVEVLLQTKGLPDEESILNTPNSEACEGIVA